MLLHTPTHCTVQILAHICFGLLLAMQNYLKKSRCSKLRQELLVTFTRAITCQPTQDSNNTSTKDRGLTLTCASHRAKTLFQNLWTEFFVPFIGLHWLVLACIPTLDDDYDDDEKNDNNNNNNNNNSSTVTSSAGQENSRLHFTNTCRVSHAKAS